MNPDDDQIRNLIDSLNMNPEREQAEAALFDLAQTVASFYHELIKAEIPHETAEVLSSLFLQRLMM